MLVEFRCKNFRNFKDEIVLDLRAGGYDFSPNAVQNEVVKTGLIYGINGSGKTNLGLAIMDISTILTDNQKHNDYHIKPLINLDCKNIEQSTIEFKYKFIFNKTVIQYNYEKTSDHRISKEDLYIGESHLLSYDHKEEKGFSNLKGSETLNLGYKKMNGIPLARFIRNNAILIDNKDSKLFSSFFRFVEIMLWFSSLDGNYEGYRFNSRRIGETIIKRGALKDFQEKLADIGIQYNLVEKKENECSSIYIKFTGENEINIFDITSKGTRSFALFYYWFLDIEKLSFIFIDEFDAFYHSKLAEKIVKMLRDSGTQVLLSTHNTGIMSNELLRPDCYFNLVKGDIKSFAKLTDSEIRKIHNLEKLFKSGLFNG